LATIGQSASSGFEALTLPFCAFARPVGTTVQDRLHPEDVHVMQASAAVSGFCAGSRACRVGAPSWQIADLEVAILLLDADRDRELLGSTESPGRGGWRKLC
jgi:hypothetical protein